MRSTVAIFLAVSAAMACLPTRAGAIVFYSTPDPGHNTSPPTGTLADSGWQWQGNWGGFLGTPIGPHHFITAQHVGGSVGDSFTLSGVSYTTTAFHNAPNCDLRIVEVGGTFPTWAPLHRGTDEVGKTLVVFGRGLGRGDEVRVGGVLKGWLYGTSGGLRWGQNAVAASTDRGPGYGYLLSASFSAYGGSEEAHLGSGDSAGGVFLQEDGIWKLAGINLAVDGPFNTTNTGSGFNAALFDVGGLYAGGSANWQKVTDRPWDIPSSFYASQISANLNWIDGIVPPGSGVEPTDAPLLPGAGGLMLCALLMGAGSLMIHCDCRV